MGIWEIPLIALVILVVFAIWHFPNIRSDLERGLKEFKNESDQISAKLQSALTGEPSSETSNPFPQFILWLAQGFGVGRLPWAPGTFGSLVGLLWFWILLLANSPLFFLVGILASIFISVRLCGTGEKILNERDPGSIVMDEIIAIPICFGGWLGWLYFKNDFWPGPEYFFSGKTALMTLGIFALFRLFDIAKPWPVKQSQNLPGGWGVTIDDVLAAVYVNLVVALVLAIWT